MKMAETTDRYLTVSGVSAPSKEPSAQPVTDTSKWMMNLNYTPRKQYSTGDMLVRRDSMSF